MIEPLSKGQASTRLSISVLIAAYNPRIEDLSGIISQILDAKKALPEIDLRVIHNDDSSLKSDEIKVIYQSAEAAGLSVHATQAFGNLGFGAGINELAKECLSDFYLILNQDAVPEPGAIEYVAKIASTASENEAIWEMRQIPFEHPKIYNPATMQTPWACGAALLIRSSAFKDVCGFEERIFMYGEDVDLSWKLRAKGWKIRYVAKAAVVHETYDDPTTSKPLQVVGAIYAGLALRARYSGRKQVFEGLTMALAEILIARQEFQGRRALILGATIRFLRDYGYYRRTSPLRRDIDFEPFYSGWSYEERRVGAFYRFKPAKESGSSMPLVSILIRTCGRPGMLRQALQSVANQTWSNIEVVVVEDGVGDAKLVCDEFSDSIKIIFKQNTIKMGRSQAGNTALALANGDWMCFLDDDDLLFADHCEVLVQSCLEKNLKGAYGLAWRVRTETLDPIAGLYHEYYRDVYPYEHFNRLSMLERNLFPIQAAIFHRSLYDHYGGFDTEMDQLEDWNLWTRYTLKDDFQLIEKTTSLYRIPARPEAGLTRQLALDEAYASAREKQDSLYVTLQVRSLKALIEKQNNQNDNSLMKTRFTRIIRNNRLLLTLHRKIQYTLRTNR